MQELAGKVAVITGAASGIGRALAVRLGQEQMRLILADIDNERLNVIGGWLDAQGVEVQTLKVDVSKAGQVESLADLAYERFGQVDLLCNNAGVQVVGAAWEHSVADWEWSLGVNLWGVIHGIRAFVPRMLARGTHGHIVNTASLAGLLSLPLSAASVTAKQAVVTVSECLHHDLALRDAKLRVSVVCPAAVNTELARSERVRPVDLTDPVATVDALENEVEVFYREQMREGLDPAFVADAIVDAVRTERFYVFTDPEAQQLLRERYEALVAGENPPTRPLAAMTVVRS